MGLEFYKGNHLLFLFQDRLWGLEFYKGNHLLFLFQD
jgi:hypothetical protein